MLNPASDINSQYLSNRFSILHSFVWYFFIGLLSALILFFYHWIWNTVRWDLPFLYLISGLCISFFGWGAERLWQTILSPMMDDVFSVFAYLTRLPFWWISGGIGYVVGIVLTKILLKVDFYEVPIKIYFFIGSFVGLILHLISQFRVHRFLQSLQKEK